MILPIVSAISREVIATVPPEHKEAALALGATRWEMIRMAVLPYSRPGITGGAMLGMGRAIGETIAVVLVIGSAPKIGSHLFSQGYTLAAVIANEFGEAAASRSTRSALFAAGLVLFVLTLIVNIIARWFVSRGTRRHGRTGRDRMTPPGRAVSCSCLEAPSEHARDSRRSAPAAGARTRSCAARCWPRRSIALVPLVLVIYYLLYKGLSAVDQERLLHDRSDRQLLRQPGWDSQRDPRLARDRRARDADLDPDRDRRGPVPDRVREGRRGSRTPCATSST